MAPTRNIVANNPSSRAAVLAVDGGNSKTDLVLIDGDGQVVATSRAPGSSHQRVGIDGALAVIRQGVAELRREIGVPIGTPIAQLGVFCLAGVDLPSDRELLRRKLSDERLVEELELDNDTLAVLWAGSPDGWGIGIAAGTGLNCVGISRDGREARYPALGLISGDWVAGGRWLGLRALGQAVRASDGRGVPTSLERAVPAYYGLQHPLEVAEAVYHGDIPERQLLWLAPTVFEQAALGDEASRRLIDQMADEIVTYVSATTETLGLKDVRVPVVLGGGLFTADDRPFLDRVRAGIRDVTGDGEIMMLEALPVLGAVLRGIDRLGLGNAASTQVRQHLRVELPAAGRA